jgi:fumarate hydratase subunit alpha
MLDEPTLVDRLARAMRDGVIELPEDVTDTIRSAFERETSDVAKMQLSAILKNIDLAHEGGTPLCQDTGVQLFFIKAGYDFPYLSEIHRAIPQAIEQATSAVPLRPNTVDPFTGKNPKNNLGHNMPVITIELREGDDADIYAFPKGGGSENMSALWMLTPAEGFNGMKKRLLTHIQDAAGKPCPPIILGIGIGGGADIALKLGKKALLRPLGSPNPDPKLDALEQEILKDVNELGIGPMGLGGKTTALAVHIEYTSRHPATFPVGLVVQCWCDRRAHVHITKNGEVN